MRGKKKPNKEAKLLFPWSAKRLQESDSPPMHQNEYAWVMENLFDGGYNMQPVYKSRRPNDRVVRSTATILDRLYGFSKSKIAPWLFLFSNDARLLEELSWTVPMTHAFTMKQGVRTITTDAFIQLLVTRKQFADFGVDNSQEAIQLTGTAGLLWWKAIDQSTPKSQQFEQPMSSMLGHRIANDLPTVFGSFSHESEKPVREVFNEAIRKIERKCGTGVGGLISECANVLRLKKADIDVKKIEDAKV